MWSSRAIEASLLSENFIFIMTKLFANFSLQLDKYIYIYVKECIIFIDLLNQSVTKSGQIIF